MRAQLGRAAAQVIGALGMTDGFVKILADAIPKRSEASAKKALVRVAMKMPVRCRMVGRRVAV